MMAGAKQSRNSQWGSQLSSVGTRFSKTKMCRFELLGMCTKGTQCPFAHGCVELKPLPDLRCTKLCRELIQFGKCTDKACSYAHSKEELRSSQERAQAMMRNGAFRQQRGGGGSGNGRSSAEVPSGKAASVTPGLAGWEGFAGASALAAAATGAGAGLSASPEAMAGFDAAFRLLAAAQAQGALHGLQGDPSTFDWQALALTMAVAAAGGAGAKAPSRAAAAPQASAMGSKGSPAYVPLRLDAGPSAHDGIGKGAFGASALSGRRGLGSDMQGACLGLPVSVGTEEEFDELDQEEDGDEEYAEHALTGPDATSWEDLYLGSALCADVGAGRAAKASEDEGLGPMSASPWAGPWAGSWSGAGWGGNWNAVATSGVPAGPSPSLLSDPMGMTASSLWAGHSVSIAQQDDPWQYVAHVLPHSGGTPKKNMRSVRTSESTICTLGDEQLRL
mmetsp:Transcript_119940/g.384053  ORF Transcript_119940/g.384053 Transcript_119940/m.384053 type:complete len:447 (+) Transcript_119940:144-1484(+)